MLIIDTNVREGRREPHDSLSDSKDKMPLSFYLSIWYRILNAHGSFNVQAFVWQTTFSAYMSFEAVLKLTQELYIGGRGENGGADCKTSKSDLWVALLP